MTEDERPRLSLRLTGGDFGDGEIPLTALARIAYETQQLVKRLARSLAERSGPGRAPAAIDEATNLLLVGLRSGSTTLDIVGSRLQQPSLLGDIGVEAIGTMLDGLQALSTERQLPAAFDDPSSRRLDGWLDLEDLRPAPQLEGVDGRRFFRNVELDELLRGKAPLRSLEDLVIEDLTDDEIEAFLAAGDD